MKTILLEEKYILEYIKSVLHDVKMGTFNVYNAKYHHNTSYRDASSVCQYGILTMMDLKKLGIKNYTDELLQKMGDIESHINGNDAVSLSVVGLQDLYPNEYEYDPFNPSQVDFLVSSEIQAGRLSIHYGNEFLSYKSIGVDKLKSVDIRLLELIELVEQGYSSSNFSIQSAIQKYNYLKNIALTMKHSQLDIPLREMSYQDNSLMDVDKLSSNPKLILKN